MQLIRIWYMTKKKSLEKEPTKLTKLRQKTNNIKTSLQFCDFYFFE